MLPAAYSEEVVNPEHVVVTRDDDGTVHLLCYAGEVLPDTFVILKHVVLSGAHSGVFAAVHGASAEDQSESPDPVGVALGCSCACGASRMSSGWCTFGHPPYWDGQAGA